MDLTQSPSGLPDVTVFRLHGPFTLATMFPFQAALREPSLKGVIIDFSGVPYTDSAGLGVILGHWSHAQRAGYRFAMVGLPPRVMTIFEITKTDKILPIFPTLADAENSFATAAA